MTDHKELFFKPGIAPSSINDFFESPSRFWLHSSYNPNRVKKPSTPAMIFGRLVHCLVLTPEAFASEFTMAPARAKDDGELETNDELKAFLTNIANQRGEKLKSGLKKDELVALLRVLAPGVMTWQEKLEAFAKENAKKTIINEEQYSKAISMQDAMLRNRAVRSLIGNGMSEEPFCWYPDGEGGLMKKCRMDYNRAGLVIEYKTADDPDESGFQRTLGNFGYHRQLATQVEACTIKYGEAPQGAVVIVQDKEMHDDIAIYALDPSDIQIGRDENAYAFAEIKRRMELMKKGVPELEAWRTFPEEIVPIKLARWYQSKAKA